MFCDGKCERGKKRCGLLNDMWQTDPAGNKIPNTEYKRCVFFAILDSNLRQEGRFVGLQASTESARNQQNQDMIESHKVHAQGWLGMLATLQGNAAGQMKALAAVEKLADFIKIADQALKNLKIDHSKVLKGDFSKNQEQLPDMDDPNQKKGLLQ